MLKAHCLSPYLKSAKSDEDLLPLDYIPGKVLSTSDFTKAMIRVRSKQKAYFLYLVPSVG